MDGKQIQFLGLFPANSKKHVFFNQTCRDSKEKDAKCQTVLRDSLDVVESIVGHKGTCMFSDILDLLPPNTMSAEWSFSQKHRASSCCCLAASAHCTVHNKQCSVQPDGVDFSVGGLPCPDYSTAGLRMKREGPTNGVYCSHGKYVTDMEIALLLVECTKVTWLIWSTTI